MVDPVEAKLGQPGYAKMKKKRPFPVRFVFLMDKSGSMAQIPDRVLWARLMIMLFLEIMVEMNKEFDTFGNLFICPGRFADT